MSFTVNVKRYSTKGGLISSKVMVGKYEESGYDVPITGSSTQHIVKYSSGQYAIEIYNPSGYGFSRVETDLPGFTRGTKYDIPNGRYYIFLPSNNKTYYVNIYYAPSI